MIPTLLAALLLAKPPAGDPALLRQLLAQAVTEQRQQVVIPPGDYRMDASAGQGMTIFLRGAHDLTIVADGVTLIGLHRVRMLEFRECRNVTLQGLSIDYDPLPFTQGTIVAIADDAGSIDVKLHAGYPHEPFSRIDLVDPQTRFRKHGMPFMWGTRAAMIEPDVVRVTLPNIGQAAAVGDLASLSTGSGNGPPHAVTIENCADVTLRHVTIHSAPGMGLVDAGGDGGTHLDGVRIVPGPMPAGATEARLLTTSWDGIQHTTVRRGPLVENCIIEDCGDDSWSVQAEAYRIVQVDGGDVLLPAPPWSVPPRAGDTVAMSLDGPVVTLTGSRSGKLIELGADPELLAKFEIKETFGWRLSAAAWPFEVGQRVYFPSRQGNRFVFRHNRIHSPGRGALIKAAGTVEDNVFESPHAGVTVCPEVAGDAGYGIDGVTIRRNRIVRSGYFCPGPWSTQAGAISITAGGPGQTFRPAGLIRNVLVEDNVCEDVQGPNLVVSSTSGLTIRGNRFVRPHVTEQAGYTGRDYGIDFGATVWLTECGGVRLEGNEVVSPGVVMMEALVTRGQVETLGEAGLSVRR